MIGLDQQGWITIIAGLLLALITLFTSYSHVDIPGFGAIGLNQQVGGWSGTWAALASH